MQTVLLAREMKQADRRAMEKYGIPSAVLMERAALAVAEEAMGKKGPVLVLAGSGNNGGDGFACARILHLRGIRTEVLAAGNPEHFTEETRNEAAICEKLGVPVTYGTDADLSGYPVLVDALFGIGLTRPVSGPHADLIARVNRAGAYVIAVDIPSGVDADTGRVCGCAVRADVTVTMQCLKPGLLLYPGAGFAGEIRVAEIGVPVLPGDGRISTARREDLTGLLPARAPSGHKGSFGKVLLIAGSAGMSGAAYLCSSSALRAGAGMVRILTPEANRPILQMMLPEAMISAWRDTEEALRMLEEDLRWCDAVVCGPGIGREESARALVRRLLESSDHPLVLDADGLNALQGDLTLMKRARGRIYITPHIGEMCALSGAEAAEIKEDPVAFASAFAREHGVVCVMKDARTAVADPNGSVFLNRLGNSGMATAGSGDVLSGILGSLLAQGTDPVKAAPAAVLLHAAAGDCAAAEEGEHYMTAVSIIGGLRPVLKGCREKKP